MAKRGKAYHKFRSLEIEERLRRLGDFVQKRRWKMELSQAEFGRRAGLSQPEISRIEQGKHLPRDRVRFADALELDGPKRLEFFDLTGYYLNVLPGSIESEQFLDRDFLWAVMESSRGAWYGEANAGHAKALLRPFLRGVAAENLGPEVMRLKADALLQLSDIAGWEGRLFSDDGMYPLGNELFELGKKLEDPVIQAQGLYHMGTAYSNSGAYGEAFELFQQASHQKLPREYLFNIDRGLLIAAAGLQHEPLVRELAEKSLREIERIDYRRFNKSMDPDRGRMPYNRFEVLGRAYLKLGSAKEAGKILGHALDHSRPSQCPFSHMILLVTLCHYYRRIGDLATSEYFRKVAFEHGRKYGFADQLQRLKQLTEKVAPMP